jgi:hypothetical protein
VSRAVVAAPFAAVRFSPASRRRTLPERASRGGHEFDFVALIPLLPHPTPIPDSIDLANRLSGMSGLKGEDGMILKRNKKLIDVVESTYSQDKDAYQKYISDKDWVGFLSVFLLDPSDAFYAQERPTEFILEDLSRRYADKVYLIDIDGKRYIILC